jgi:serine/threonine-protein kinase
MSAGPLRTPPGAGDRVDTSPLGTPAISVADDAKTDPPPAAVVFEPEPESGVANATVPAPAPKVGSAFAPKVPIPRPPTPPVGFQPVRIGTDPKLPPVVEKEKESQPRVPAAKPMPASAPRIPVARPPTPSVGFSPMRPPSPPAPAVVPAQGTAPTQLGPPGGPSPAAQSQGAASQPNMPVVMEASGEMGAPLPFTKYCSSCDARYPADFLLCPRDATPLVDENAHNEDPWVGKLLGETYQIVRVVGEGGMGKVYEARHLRLRDKRFAVKMLHPELARQTELVTRFSREAEAAAKVDHDNVVDVFDVHKTVDGIPYIVGEFLEGEELGEYLDKHTKLDVRAGVKIVRQVCRALGAAHSAGVVHRDMKPENVFMLARDGQIFVKVLDFGISRVESRETHLTKTGMIMGTPSYMAPEQARGEVVDLRADIYSVGALFYHMLTGRRPFWSEDPTTIISMVLTKDPARPRSLEPSIPEGIEFIIQKAMAKDPRERFQSMADFDAALAAFDEQRGPMISRPDVPGAPVQPQNVIEGLTAAAGSSVVPPAADAGGSRLSRPTIIALSVALGAWLMGGIVDALAGVVRIAHAGELTVTECVLLLVGTLFAASTPTVLYVLHLRRVVWPNSVKAMQLASDLRRTAAAALASYGALALFGRALYTVFFRQSPLLSRGWWDVALFLMSLVVALTAGGIGVFARISRRNQNG